MHVHSSASVPGLAGVGARDDGGSGRRAESQTALRSGYYGVTVMVARILTTYAEMGWTEPVFSFSWDGNNPRRWKHGNYRVDLLVNGNKITSEIHQIF